jgi:hypothetical protein
MNKAIDDCRAIMAREHEAWYREKTKDKVRFFPFGSDWAEAAETMTPEEREYYQEHISKSQTIKRLIADILAKVRVDK